MLGVHRECGDGGKEERLHLDLPRSHSSSLEPGDSEDLG